MNWHDRSGGEFNGVCPCRQEVRLSIRSQARCRGVLIRINPRDAKVPANQVPLPLGALAGLRAILSRQPASLIELPFQLEFFGTCREDD